MVLETKSFLSESARNPCEQWIGSPKLMQIFRSSMRHVSLEEKVKIVYGFEQVLPQVAYL